MFILDLFRPGLLEVGRAEELKGMLILTAGYQSGNDSIGMATGAVVSPFSIPDHVLLNGQSVFFPGTYSAGLDQGGEPFRV